MKNEMTKLIEILKKSNIPFQVTSCWGAPQVCIPIGNTLSVMPSATSSALVAKMVCLK